MKLVLIALLFTAVSFAQTDVKAQYDQFQKELEEYRSDPQVSSENSTIKPAPCGQYNLKFMVAGQGFDEKVTVPPARKLCADLKRFDKSQNPNPSPDWDYEIKAVGNRYYVIRADKKGTAGVQEFYYYERKVTK
ncbi:MAG TPA: hypothetical protein PLS51_08380 [Flavobacterium sp.]|jgi:hypothetical protein|nr:hypothetical protein [Flavobacterium sp.]HPJ10632.1 hypothetical protein [Flavobacterium sp.]